MEIGKIHSRNLDDKDMSIFKKIWKRIKEERFLLLLVSPAVLYFIIFHYVPMYGILIAFKDFSITDGIIGSDWAGLKYFQQFFDSYYFWRLMRNTLLISFYSLIWAFPIPIIFALVLNEFRDGLFKRTVQTVTYFPHFISVVIVVGIMVNFLSPINGVINNLLDLFGINAINFMNDPGWFRTLFIGSNIWQEFGWGSIIYLAALAGINPELYEASKIDGANRWHQLIYITLPSIAPTIIILLILNVGQLMNVGFEKIILMYSPSTYETADVISTYVYRQGILSSQYSFGAAVGFFNSIINLILLVSANFISRKVTNNSLW